MDDLSRSVRVNYAPRVWIPPFGNVVRVTLDRRLLEKAVGIVTAHQAPENVVGGFDASEFELRAPVYADQNGDAAANRVRAGRSRGKNRVDALRSAGRADKVGGFHASILRFLWWFHDWRGRRPGGRPQSTNAVKDRRLLHSREHTSPLAGVLHGLS